jgi:glutamyl-tRNA(Gln) amidotransferase subunit E
MEDCPMDQNEIKSLGFKCGVEIHQQLLTKTKLFCRCPAGLYTTKHDAEIIRHMRPTLSEMGIYDGCALMEFKTKKEIVYLLNKESVCTYEMDDTPPFHINQEALDIAIEIALLLNCQIVDEMHIARKQYLDGSIPTGFQRTAIIGINGFIDMPGKRIRIRQLSLEEDACREVKDEGHTIIFRTDRLGMPLIEVVTEPDFTGPEEAAFGVKTIGRLLRATGKVRRGIGAVRQDVNVSIEGGRRVEIKGVPRYQLISSLTRIEALRQKALLDLSHELKRRGLTPENIKSEQADITSDMQHTRSEILKSALGKKHKIRGIRIDGAAGLLNWKTQPGKTFAHELSGRVRVIACLDNIPNLFHTDHFPDYAGSHIDLRRIRNIFRLTEKDAAVIVWGPEADTATACNEIRDRIIEAVNGVPHETRQHLRDGLTDFERILPGADRMYPDTDHPPLRISHERVEKIKSSLPEKTIDVENRFRSYGLPHDCIERLALSSYKTLVDRLAQSGTDMKIVGRLLGQTVPSLIRQGHCLDSIDMCAWTRLVDACIKHNVQRKFFEEIVLRLAHNPNLETDILLYGFVNPPTKNNLPFPEDGFRNHQGQKINSPEPECAGNHGGPER